MRHAPLLALALAMAAPAALAAQSLLVSPTTVLIDPRTRSAAIQLVNSSAQPIEADLELFYAVPETDSLDGFHLDPVAAPGPREPNAAAWVRLFPRKVTVAPRQTQTVRLLASPPADLADGEYWGRLAIASRLAPAAAGASDTTAVSTRIDLVVRSLVPLLYRKGRVAPAPALERLRVEGRPDSVVVRARLANGGPAVAFGTLRLLDGARVLATQTASVYRGTWVRLAAPRAGLAAGQRLRVEFAAGRADLDRAVPMPFAVVADSVAVPR
ncbi:MAG: hypothetical protein NW201_09690 [Gemmatimonadales bacterium]|nr:hypothetical protein [Gemmatimonadales bacterium]